MCYAVVSCQRIGRERFRFHVWRVIAPPRPGREAAELRAVTAEINAALSEAILQRPAQWLWGSRRFLTRPEGEALEVDGLPPPAARFREQIPERSGA